MEIKNNIIKCMSELNDLIDSFHEPVLIKGQKEQYKRYFQALMQTNELHNLTAITDPGKIISHHLKDSLAIVNYLDLTSDDCFVDIGSGAGFPGIPLKIYAPQVRMILIEVNTKKIAFLEQVICDLNLENIFVYPHDWRTFLRKTKFDVTVFLSRASLHPEELIRVFRPTSFYRDSLLVYYASDKWQPTGLQESYIDKRVAYNIDHKTRTFVFFRNIPTMNLEEKNEKK